MLHEESTCSNYNAIIRQVEVSPYVHTIPKLIRDERRMGNMEDGLLSTG